MIDSAFPAWKGNGRPVADRQPSMRRSTRDATNAERCFNNPKRWRGTAMRTDKTTRNHMAAIQLAAALNRLGASSSNAP